MNKRKGHRTVRAACFVFKVIFGRKSPEKDEVVEEK